MTGLTLSPPLPQPLADRREEVETPERVAIAYELADLGSRFSALLIDGAILAVTLILLLIGLVYLLPRVAGISVPLAGWTVAAYLLLNFAIIWGYFIYFEGFHDGRTPGKRRLRIRAVHDGGYPLTIRGAAVRNLLRLIDLQPFPSCLAGGIVMMLHPRTKRIGDLVAGTVVVRERLTPRLPEEEEAVAVASGTPRLRPAELAALTQYIARRDSLPEDARDRITATLLERLAPRFQDDERQDTLPGAEFLAAFHAEELARISAAGGGSSGSAQAAALARRQRPVWDEYRVLVERAQRRGLARLTESEVSRFAALYREVAADLARARTYGGSEALTYSLERWVGAGHNLLYRPVGRSWRTFRAWAAGGFPLLVRQRWRPIALAAALLYLPTLLTFTAVRLEPTRAMDLLPAGMIARAEDAPRREAAGGEYVDVPEVFMPVMAGGIIANNIQVTLLAFVGGILAGLGTILILIFNGVQLGAVMALFANHGASLQLWSFILPHGVIELTAICIAGGAGLWLGSGIVLPGRGRRRDVVVRRGREAVSLVAGVALLLVIAGLIEGFISPAQIPRALKLLLALTFALLLAFYLLAAGEDQSSPRRFTSR
jgi:uncharacterized membrane protein SpoIIM required for sporulation/uncharacterized RDD family membrane protein YckC